MGSPIPNKLSNSKPRRVPPQDEAGQFKNKFPERLLPPPHCTNLYGDLTMLALISYRDYISVAPASADDRSRSIDVRFSTADSSSAPTKDPTRVAKSRSKLSVS